MRMNEMRGSIVFLLGHRIMALTQVAQLMMMAGHQEQKVSGREIRYYGQKMWRTTIALIVLYSLVTGVYQREGRMDGRRRQ